MDTTGQSPSPEEQDAPQPEQQPEQPSSSGSEPAPEPRSDADAPHAEAHAEAASGASAADEPTQHIPAPRSSAGPAGAPNPTDAVPPPPSAPPPAPPVFHVSGHPAPAEPEPDIPTAALPVAGHGGERPDGYTNGVRPARPQPPALVPDDWPIYVPPSRPLRPARDLQLDQRWSRRRRRYTLYVRRLSRARQTARTKTVTRIAWATTIILAVLIISIVGSTVAAAASYYNSETNLIKGLQHTIAAKDSVRLYDDKGNLLYQLNDFGAQHSITLAQVPVDAVNATVAIEDHDFWNNDGVDFTSIVRAAQDDITSHQISQGGSTITQQLVKGQILGGQVTFQRKLYEAILSVGMTSQGVYTKRQILEMYLNSIPYSPTAYGIDAAAQEYFNYQDDPTTGMTAAQRLDLAQASMLAGIPQNPNQNDPLLHPEAAHARQWQVLQAMVRYGYISQQQAADAYREAGQPRFYRPVSQEQNKAPQFVYFVINQLQNMIDTGQLHNLSRSGLNVYTTLDMDLQNHAQQAMNDHLHGNDQAGFPPFPYIKYANVTNSAEIMAENAADGDAGAIKVYIGSANYNSPSGKFDVVSQGFRGPGSSFKPFVYATAFEKGWFPAMVVNDDPTAFYDAGSGVFKPLDFTNDEAKGQVTLRTALDWSLNIPAVKVMQYAGIDAVRNQVERMGITQWPATARWGLSTVLGSLDVTPFEMAQAYSVFANYGQFYPLHAIDSISDSYGNQLFKYQVPQPVQVMDPRIAFLITSMLTDNASRQGDFGQCSPLYLAPYFGLSHPHYGPTEGSAYSTPECARVSANNDLSPNAWPTAAKTGTGQNFTDDWTMGYTMDYTTAVWVGNNDHTPMIDIDGVTGAAPIWYQSMIYAESSTGKAKRPFPVPKGVHQARYCTNGVCTTDWFLDGQTPRPNLGEKQESVPCVSILPQGGWDYSSKCGIAYKPGAKQNIGAPPPIRYHGQLAVGAP